MQCRLSRGNLYVERRGSGPPLLLVHGFPLDHSMWRFQLEELADQCDVIAPDLRGFGRSSVTPGTVTMADFADDLAELLDSLRMHQPVTLCGLSMGGYIAFQFWQRHAQRLGRLILCDTRAASDTAEAARQRLVNAQRVLDEGPQFVSESMLDKLFVDSSRRRYPERVEAVRAVMTSVPAEGLAAALRGMAERPDVTEWLDRFRVPTLVLCGAGDAISPPAEMQALAQAIPGAEYHTVPEAGHLSPLENPEFVNAAIRTWLAVDRPH
jgi:3-oxoadipate enol-lactonase